MPSLITHDFFGRDLCDKHHARIGHTQDDFDAFLLGCQGPDPLFYLAALPTAQAFKRLGNDMHRLKTPQLLASFKDALETLDKSEASIGRSYVHGFLCHFALDSTLHPFIYSQQYAFCDAGVDGLNRTDGSEVHALIESDLDEMVLFVKSGETVATYQPWVRCLRGSKHVLAIISKLYVDVMKRVYGINVPRNLFARATQSFRRVQHALYSPYNGKSNVLSKVERLARPHSFYAAMSHRAIEHTTSPFDNHNHKLWKNPFTAAASTKSFWDLYAEAQVQAKTLIEAFDSPDFSAKKATELTNNVDFSGIPQ